MCDNNETSGEGNTECSDSATFSVEAKHRPRSISYQSGNMTYVIRKRLSVIIDYTVYHFIITNTE